MDNPAQPTSKEASPSSGNNATADPTNQVQRADRGGQSTAPRAEENRTDNPDGVQRQPGRPDQAAPVQPAEDRPANKRRKPGDATTPGAPKTTRLRRTEGRTTLSPPGPAGPVESLAPRPQTARMHRDNPTPRRARDVVPTRKIKVIRKRLAPATTSRGIPSMRQTDRLTSRKTASRACAILPIDAVTTTPPKNQPRPRIRTGRTRKETLGRTRRTTTPVATADPAPMHPRKRIALSA